MKKIKYLLTLISFVFACTSLADAYEGNAGSSSSWNTGSSGSMNLVNIAPSPDYTGNPFLLARDAFSSITQLTMIFSDKSLDTTPTEYVFDFLEERSFEIWDLSGLNFADTSDLLGGNFIFGDLSSPNFYMGTFDNLNDGRWQVSFILIPEPSTYAMIFGLFALAFAIHYKRRV